ncbi:MAG: chemotaxis protein CheW [Mariprofundaceae bacterium]|nr:chemotaxis protein CheW [Mariprofundaceae bacterium]
MSEAVAEAEPEVKDDLAEARNQYLTFMLADEEYGVDILRVQEIKCWEEVTDIPNTPDFIKGVMNLRGAIVPIIDLRLRFSMESVEYDTQKTVVIVLKVLSEKGERTIGVVADAVSDVCNVSPEELRVAPDFGGAINIEFIRGLASVNDKMVILLNIDHLINQGVLQHVQAEATV